MTKATLLATAASFAILFGGAASVSAQNSGAGSLVGIEALDDRIDDIEEDTDDLFAEGEDDNRFGNQTFGPGWTGSVSIAGSIESGNIESTDFDLAGRVRNSTGPWNQTVGLAFEYGKDDDVENEKSVFGVYDVNRDISDRLYVFGLARAEYDEFDPFRRDAFAGVGPGYRIFNQPDLAWRVQAGPGVRFTETSRADVVDANGVVIGEVGGDDETEFGALASSFFYWQIAENVAMTNDTNVLYSDVNTLITNDLGVNLRVTDLVSTRLGYRTEYVTDLGDLEDAEFDETSNEFTAALVFSIR